MKRELSKQYQPNETEDRIYKYWLDNDCFKATVDNQKKPYLLLINTAPTRSDPQERNLL